MTKPEQGEVLCAVRDLTLEFGAVRALDGVSLNIRSRQTVCLVGESGSGKSVTGLSLAKLLPSPPAHYPAGEILFAGQDVLRMGPRELRDLRGGSISYIFQDPSASLNPVLRVGTQIRESLSLHVPEAATHAEVARLLSLVGIANPEWSARRYPHQLSGGMQQRVMIAMALAARPQLLVADEPTTALDVTIQAQIFDLLRDLQGRFGMSILLITHNLALVGLMADTVVVLYAGQVVESAPAAELMRAPRHPYTRALMAAVPRIGDRAERLKAIPGQVPVPGAWPAGCRFHPRCAHARPDCAHVVPDLEDAGAGCRVRCRYWKELA